MNPKDISYPGATILFPEFFNDSINTSVYQGISTQGKFSHDNSRFHLNVLTNKGYGIESNLNTW